jgi:hypothetical protein
MFIRKKERYLFLFFGCLREENVTACLQSPGSPQQDLCGFIKQLVNENSLFWLGC